jgi:hypothetical protein
VANGSIVSPLEMLRAPLSTFSAAHSFPAVSSTYAPAASATMKLLW